VGEGLAQGQGSQDGPPWRASGLALPTQSLSFCQPQSENCPCAPGWCPVSPLLTFPRQYRTSLPPTPDRIEDIRTWEAAAMAPDRHPGPAPRLAAWGWFLLGGPLAGILLLGVAECFLRLFPPQDLHPYLGEEAPLTGIYAPDPELGARYRCWEAFRDDNAV